MLPVAGPRDRAGLQAAQADAAGARLRPGVPAVHRSRRSPSTSTGRDRARCRREWDRRRHPGPAQGARLALPRDHPADRRLRPAASAGTARATWSTVYVPEYVVGHWWEQLLHNQSALRLKTRLLFTPGRHGGQRAVPARVRPGGAERRADADGDRRVRWSTVPREAEPTRRTDAAADAHEPPEQPRRDADAAVAGRLIELDVGPVAHGGHCVARHEGQVVFVRHALPGERVLARGHRGRSEGAVPARRRRRGARPPRRTGWRAPCPYAGPGGCGGCDFQHAAACRASDDSRPTVVREQLRRLARVGAGPVVDGRRGRGGARRRRRARLAHPGPVRRRRRRVGPGCAGTARTRS